MMWPGPDKSVFYLDPAAGLDSSNRWIDSSPFGLAVTPVGYAAPNYGLSLGPSGAPRITVNGVNQCGTMPAAMQARFYTVAPTTQYTFACVVRYNLPVAGDRLFSCENVAGTRGIDCQLAPTLEQLRIRAYDAGGVLHTSATTAAIPLTARTRIAIGSIDVTNSVSSWWIDGSQVTGTYAGGAAAAIAYDTAQVVVIGGVYWGAPVVPIDGDIYFEGLWNFLWTDSEAKAFSAFWMDRT